MIKGWLCFFMRSAHPLHRGSLLTDPVSPFTADRQPPVLTVYLDTLAPLAKLRGMRRARGVK